MNGRVVKLHLCSNFPDISSDFPAFLQSFLSSLPLLVRHFPHLVLEQNQRTFTLRVDLNKVSAIFNVLVKLVDKECD